MTYALCVVVVADAAANDHSASRPAVRHLEIISRPQQDERVYAIAEAIELRAIFDAVVVVDDSQGTPAISLTVGDREWSAVYTAGSGSDQLGFTWIIQEGAVDPDGVSVAEGRIALRGGIIRDRAGTQAALHHPAVMPSPDHQVDAVRPLLAQEGGVSVSGTGIVLRFDEALDANFVPAADAFALLDPGEEEPRRTATAVTVRGSSVELSVGRLSGLDAATVGIVYTPPQALGTMLRDRVGNAVAGFTATADDAPEMASRRLAATPAPPQGSLPPRTLRRIGELLAEKAQRTPAQRKLGSRLLVAAADGTGQAEVDIRADVTEDLLRHIEDLGGHVLGVHASYRTVRAQLPLAAAETLAESSNVRSIRQASKAATRARAAGSGAAFGKNTSEGDTAHRAASARTTHGVDGSGVIVGVISTGVDTLDARQASGDLPADVLVLTGQSGVGDEGTATLEIIHDLAPGAGLLFASGKGGKASFARNVKALCDAGARIVVANMFYYDEPAFQDGVIARAMNDAVGDGCFVLAAIGNNGNFNDGTSGVWEGDFSSTGTVYDRYNTPAGDIHDFGEDAIENRIVDPADAYILQWADAWGTSTNDYDLFLVDSDGDVVDKSTDFQDGTQDPYEIIYGSDDDTNRRLVVVQYSGAARFLRLEALRGRMALTTAGNARDHGAAEKVISVAAVSASTAGGTDSEFDGTESVATYSSDGPRRIFFEPGGNAITADDFSSSGGKSLAKPDIAAATCVTTATPGYTTFCGTSAAAPHAAAIGALMIEAAGGPKGMTASTFRSALTGSALDIEADGIDRDSGAGVVMAPAAVAAVKADDRNRAPVNAVNLATQTIRVGVAKTINLATAFSDPDDDALSYAVTARGALSGMAPFIDAVVTGSNLVLTVRVPGRLRVTVRATDPDGLVVQQSFSVAVSRGDHDYDADDDGLIEVASLAALDGIRHDGTGDGIVGFDNEESYNAAFPNRRLDMGCPAGCTGYELTADLDFDTDGSGAADAADDYWNGGAGWAPIADFYATLDGGGHVVRNLYVNRAGEDGVGLIGDLGWRSTVRNLGLVNVTVTGRDYVGGLAGIGRGLVFNTYATGRVVGDSWVGGLFGAVSGFTNHLGATYASVNVSGFERVGGLVGVNRGVIAASYATGRVRGSFETGGLTGENIAYVRASYATGPVLMTAGRGGNGLTGTSGGTFTNSYWDSDTYGSRGNRGATTAQLQAPTGYQGIYARWNVDADNDGGNDSPWNFGTSDQYPAVQADFDGDGSSTWQEFGYQLRDRPTLAAEGGEDRITLSWTAVDATHWTPAPSVTYSVTRRLGHTIETLASGLTALTYTDTNPVTGTHYAYAVAVNVNGGAAAHSAEVAASTVAAALPAVSVSAAADQVQEGTTAEFTVSLDKTASRPLRVALQIDEDGDSLSGALPETVAFATGDQSQSVTVETSNDDTIEPDSTVTLTLSAGSGYDLGTPTSAHVVVEDDDEAVFAVSASPTEIEEGESATVTIAISNGKSFAEQQSIGLATTGTVATADYELPDAVTIAVGASSTTATFDAVDDSESEPAETAMVEASLGGSSIGSATVTINASDPVTTDATLSALSLSGIDIGTFSPTATNYNATVAYDVTATTVTATASQAAASVSITDRDGTTDGGTRRVTLTEGENRITVTVSASASEGTAATTYSVTVTRSPPKAMIVADRTSIDEGDTATFTVTLDAAPEQALVLSLTMRETGSMLAATVPASVTIAADSTSATVRVATVDDAVVEADSTLTASLTAGADYVLGSDRDASVVVEDNDRVTFALTASPTVIDEGGRSTVTVSTGSASYAVDQTIVLSVSGTAASADYLLTPRTLTLAAGSSAASAGLTAVDDMEEEDSETVVVQARHDGVPIGSAVVTIAASDTVLRVGALPPVLLFPAAADPLRQGFVRIVNGSDADAEVHIDAFDNEGWRANTVTMALDAGVVTHFNSVHLEEGDPERGLSTGVGQGVGDWRLELTGDLNVDVLSYVRTADGFVTSLHDTVPVEGDTHRVVFFNPGRNVDQMSRLRLVNPENTRAEATIVGIDDAGTRSGDVRVAIAARSSLDLTSVELESGAGVGIESGSMGTGEGKWRLEITSDASILAMSLLESAGHLTNLSTATQTAGTAEGSVFVPLFPSMANPLLQGFVRVINHSASAGDVLVDAFDDTDRVYERVTLSVGAGGAAHFNSDDLELGNTNKGLAGSTGAGEGPWRLEVTSELEIEVFAYVRTVHGFVTSMHDLAPAVDDMHRVAFLNPASNTEQASRIRLVNPGATDARVTIVGIDDSGGISDSAVLATVTAGRALELTAVELESGMGDGITGGALGDGHGKWRLQIEAEAPIHVLSLLRSPAGHLTNLSTWP